MEYHQNRGHYPLDHCNSKAVIMSLEIAMTRSKTVLSTRSTVSDLQNQEITVTIHWVPGHVDVQGTERADDLAKLSSTTPFIEAEPALSLHCKISMAESVTHCRLAD